MSFDPGLKPGQVLNNDQLVEIFRVSPQGGMRRSKRTNSLVLVADHTRSLYTDRWEGKVFHYTGMGQVGDQSLDYRQNKVLAQSGKNGIDVYLFEVFKTREYTYDGEVELAGAPYQERQEDDEGRARNVWIFPLRLLHEK